MQRVNSDKGTNEYTTRFINLTTAADMIFLNGRAGSDEGVGRKTFFGHRGVTAIDYVICNKYALCKVIDFHVHDPKVFSDHVILSFSLSTDVNVHENDKNGKKDRVYAKWREERKVEFVEKVMSNGVEERVRLMTDLMTNNASTDVLEETVLGLTDVLVTAGSGHIHTFRQGEGGKGQRRKQAAWYDETCRNQLDRFTECKERFFGEQTDENRAMMCVERNVYRKMCRRKRNEYKRSESLRLLELSKKDPKAFWKEIKPKKAGAGLPDIDFHQHFKTLAERETILNEEGKAEIEECFRQNEESYIEELDAPMTMEELEKGIKDLKSEKASGVDLILNEFIVNASYSIKCLILLIFNNILLLEYFPDCWAKGDIIPIFKKGDINSANNYRGITLLSCLGKLFTRMMNTRLTKWAEAKEKLNETQFGFRMGMGTRDCLFVLHGLITLLFSKGMQLYCCFVDYEKAYDYLDRSTIWTKLIKAGASSKSIRLFQNLYNKMKLTVRGDEQSRYFSSDCGLLQGESTSPIIFSFFVNDLDEYLSDENVGVKVWDYLVKLLKFADDMAIFSKTREGLQIGLDNLGEYCQKWGITVNIPKTKIVVFRKGGQLSVLDTWTLLGKEIEVVSFFKYLGCFLTSGGSFTKCVAELTNSARRALFALRKHFSSNPEMLPVMQLQLFNTMVSPILFYACEVWGLRAADPMEVFYRGFLKTILRVKASTPDCFVYGELGVFPLYIERYTRVMAYWVKLISAGENDKSLVVKVYREQYNLTLDQPDAVTWASLVKKTVK